MSRSSEIKALRMEGGTPVGRGTPRLWRDGLAVLLTLAMIPSLNPAQQQQQTGQTSSASQVYREMQAEIAAQNTTFRDPGSEIYPMEAIDRERRLKAMNAQRQKSMVEDTNKLVQMTAQLNAEVNKGHQQSLNAEQLRQVAEIEKLAKSIREKMSNAIGPTPPSMEPSGMMGPRFP